MSSLLRGCGDGERRDELFVGEATCFVQKSGFRFLAPALRCGFVIFQFFPAYKKAGESGTYCPPTLAPTV